MLLVGNLEGVGKESIEPFPLTTMCSSCLDGGGGKDQLPRAGVNWGRSGESLSLALSLSLH